MPHTSQYESYRKMTEKAPLQFPLAGEDNRPIRDAAGRLVSICEHAKVFTQAINLVAEIAAHNEVSMQAIVSRSWIDRARSIINQS